MTLEEIVYILSQYSPIWDQPEEVNTRLNWGQSQLYFQLIAAKDWVSLRPFKVIKGENGTPPLHFVNGVCNVPSDFQVEEKAYHILDGDEVRINILDDDQFEVFKTNGMEYPTQKYPIANIQSNYIRLLPKDIRFVVFSYIKTATPVFYAVDTTLGYAQYDSANSIEFEWEETEQVAIIMIVLSSLGINTTKEEIESKRKR
jgi:hypothetical protein